MPTLTPLLESLHAQIGNGAFLAASIVLAILLSFIGIPRSTDLMVNSAAGLAGKYLGKRTRTLVINASTNNPEAFSMAVSFGLKRMGGWSNPLGSLLANIYLMYGAALAIALIRLAARRDFERARRLLGLFRREFGLAVLHLVLSCATFLAGLWALRIMMTRTEQPVIGVHVLWTGMILAGAIALFWLVVERGLKRRRPELFDDMDATDHRESWSGFAVGTVAVIACCYVVNELFLAWSEIYSTPLSGVFGPLIFAWLHYFAGALVTSLPEMTVAVRNFEKASPADFNTALGSVSYSNMVNLAIALLGLLIWVGLGSIGITFVW